MKLGWPLSPFFFQYSVWSTSWSNNEREGKGDIELSLFTDVMMLCVSDVKIPPGHF